jgi:hypothetical protein
MSHRALGPQFDLEHQHDAEHPATMGGSFTAWHGDEEAAHLTYTEHPEHVLVHTRETAPPFRHQGLATHLQDQLHATFPDKPVVSDPEDFSGDAAAFREKYLQQRPNARWRVG